MKETIIVNVGNKSMTAAVLNFYFPAELNKEF